METSDEERKTWCREDAAAIMSYADATLKPASYTLIGKSAGTRCIAGLLESDCKNIDQIVWLTPALQNNWHLIRENTARNYTVIGTKDQWWEIAKNHLSENHHVVEGADHSLEIESDIQASITTLSEIIKKLDLWIN